MGEPARIPYCLLPPPEGEGVQIHFGPKSYDDPAEVEK